ncbi:BINDING PROTEIN putative-RELATED [Salix purpurea]|uniref:BINDING PROTEIN putative-RELATED n=1 Tax=Salix purpurea TaxID=77065 RepID=A0A9Q0ZH75_SALPP|nr:BINDING PROTEIN putative-RELATED [Salix purpurea]
MISAKKLIKLARKWQKLAAIGRKRITLPHPFERTDARSCSISSTTEKGHFVVYSIDQKRFLLPLKYLNSNIVRDLLKIAEEEFGLPGDGPLTLPCDSDLLKYVFSLIKNHITADVEKALLISIARSHCSLSLDPHQEVTTHQIPICSF